MRTLPQVTPTSEQLKIVSRTRPGVEVIRGAAGSGKTTTAILRLRGLTGVFLNRRSSTNSQIPVRALVVTFNRTLRGYVEQLASEQTSLDQSVQLEVDTFAHWALGLTGNTSIVQDEQRRSKVIELGKSIRLDKEFLCSEVDYICGKFLPESLDTYLVARRDGRGLIPRVDKELREQIIHDVIRPYKQWKKENNLNDWSDLAVALAKQRHGYGYDIIIADETQDFSANQVRALLTQAASESAVTFILDSAQRIYPHGFTWAEVGVTVTATNSHRLESNYRNTAEIAAFAAPLVEGITTGDVDATIPNLERCDRHGVLPRILVGRFSDQLASAIEFISKQVDLTKESVAFLHPKGAGWFQATKDALALSGIGFAEITRRSDWPKGPENVALSTIHSAKGLEFDHVFLLGLNAELLPHGSEPGDDSMNYLRRLLAMGITRARSTVILGYKNTDRSALIDLFKIGTYLEVRL